MNSFSVVDDRKGNYSINFTPEMAGSHEIVILVDNTVVKYVIYSILNLFIYLFRKEKIEVKSNAVPSNSFLRVQLHRHYVIGATLILTLQLVGMKDKTFMN